MTNEEIKELIPDDHRKFILLSVALEYNKYLKKLPDNGRMIETGTGFAHSTIFFARAKPNWTIYTVDGYGLFGEKSLYPYDPVDGNRTMGIIDLRKNLSLFEQEGNVVQIIQNSTKVPWELEVDVIYIDGDHTYEGCKADFDRYSPFLKEGGYIFVDDYFREDFGVKQLVDEVAENGWKLLYADRVAILERAK